MYTVEEITATLKQAREAKGLSQRALSAKSGLTQKHISKIENADVDLRLSNLLELARALDLEVMLVPRKAVAAAQGLVRSIESDTHAPADATKSVRRLAHAAEDIRSLLPDSKEVERLKELAMTFQNFRLTSEQHQIIQNATRELQRARVVIPQLHDLLDNEDE